MKLANIILQNTTKGINLHQTFAELFAIRFDVKILIIYFCLYEQHHAKKNF